ncbi:MAG: AmmeMemoRadiSam system protein A [Sedimentisphaerales bacterium]|nr:AmmeMemoRadiSam system protein A [Sedimentisphaerales bacterium]
MNDQQKKVLLTTAKNAIIAAVRRQPIPKPTTDDPDLQQKCGCFVTLKNHGRLRGCIGQFTANKPLIDMVNEMGVSSATRDPRFVSNPITSKELDQLTIEISVLSPLQRTDDPLSLQLGVDGIYIVRGFQSGCFLPQVATETGWNKEEFLSYCCSHKALLPGDAWKDPATEVYLFTVEAFEGELAEI